MKKIIRKILFINPSEKISDGIQRHLLKMKKVINNNKKDISEALFFANLKNMGVGKGDVIMIHASWRHFYRYNGNPESFIKKMMEVVGDDGTILMPSFGSSLDYFDVNNTPSNAGVLSEVFRKFPNVIRSECSHFPISAWGKNANEIIKNHKYSVFGFDTYSPYYRITQIPNVKIIKLGMGKYPKKTTLIHCVEYIYREKIPFFKNYISESYMATIIDGRGITIQRNMVKGKPARLNYKNIKLFYKKLPVSSTKYRKIGNIDVRIIVADKSFNILKEITKKDIFMVKLI